MLEENTSSRNSHPERTREGSGRLRATRSRSFTSTFRMTFFGDRHAVQKVLICAIACWSAFAVAAEKPVAMDFSIGNDVPLHVMALKDAQQQMEAIAKGAKAAQVTAF